MAIYLKNAVYIDWQNYKFTECNIKVEQGLDKKITFVKSFTPTSKDEVIDCKGKYVTKSFACGHHHIYSALACGMPAPQEIPNNFHEILQYIWWNLDKKLDKEMIEASAYATAIELIKNGSTFVIDHHASPFCIEGSLDIIANVFEKVGISSLLCYEISDRDGIEKAEEGLDENERYIKSKQGLIGVHASFTVENQTMKKVARLVDKYNSGVHIHVAEDILDQELCIKNYEKTVIERLTDYGFLENSKSIMAHAIYISETERSILKYSNAWLVVNSESNQNNKVGKFSSLGIGEKIMLGTDGMHSDMLRSAKSYFLGCEKNENVDYQTAYKRFRNVHNYLKFNDFKGDGENNLVILDYQPRTDFNQENFLGHFIFAINNANIQHVIANGELILKDRKLTKIDETEILNFSKEQSKRLWNELKK